MTPDPIGLAGGINPFVYSLNNPINLIDPLGLWGLNVAGSSMGIDLTATIYDSGKGWFPNPNDDINVSFGLLNKYTGVTYDTNLNRGS